MKRELSMNWENTSSLTSTLPPIWSNFLEKPSMIIMHNWERVKCTDLNLPSTRMKRWEYWENMSKNSKSLTQTGKIKESLRKLIRKIPLIFHLFLFLIYKLSNYLNHRNSNPRKNSLPPSPSILKQVMKPTISKKKVAKKIYRVPSSKTFQLPLLTLI